MIVVSCLHAVNPLRHRRIAYKGSKLKNIYRIAALAALALATSTTSMVSAATLTTTFASNNAQNGNIFDIQVSGNSITLNSVLLNLSGTGAANLEFYYRPGTAVGFQNSSAGWTLFSSNQGVSSSGTNIGSLVDIANLTLQANSRYGIYFTRTDSGLLNYTNGTAVGNVAATNSDFTVYEGFGQQYPFAASFSPRIVNATFNYSVNSAVPEPATWAMMLMGIGFIGGAMRVSKRRKLIAKGYVEPSEGFREALILR